jgi:hypothetical protein
MVAREEQDHAVIDLTVMAIKNGWYHLDGAEGKLSPYLSHTLAITDLET